MDFNDPRLQQAPVPYTDAPPAQPQQQAPAFDPMSDPAFRSFVAQRAQQMQELKAAQEQAAQNRNSLGFRIGNALALGGGATEADMQGRYARAGQPVADVLQRMQAGRDITAGGETEQKLEGTARQNQLAVMAQDPNSALSRRSQMMIAPIVGEQMARQLTHADIDRALQISKAGGDLSKTLAEAARERATAGKTEAETKEVAPSAAAERTLKGAQATEATAAATKAEADAAHTRMLTSGEVVPGLTRGTVPIDEATQAKLNEQYKDYVGSRDALNEIINTVGDKNFIKDPAVRAKLQPRLAELTGQLRSSVGMRSLAGPEMEFAKKLIADPTAVSLSNLTGWAHNADRLKSAREGLDTHWKSTVKAYDLRGNAQTQSTGGRVNVFDPSGKPVNLPSDQVDAYLKANAGAKRAGI